MCWLNSCRSGFRNVQSPWRWRQQITLKCRGRKLVLYGVRIQTTTISAITAQWKQEKLFIIKIPINVIPVGAYIGPEDSRNLRLPHFSVSWYTKEASLPTQRTDCLYPQGRPLVLIYVRGWVNSRAIMRPEILIQRKNLKYHMVNRTLHLPDCKKNALTNCATTYPHKESISEKNFTP